MKVDLESPSSVAALTALHTERAGINSMPLATLACSTFSA
jgi:hypothetical protein